MYFDPVTGWLTALIFDSLAIMKEKNTGSNLSEYKKERIESIHRSFNGDVAKRYKKYSTILAGMALEQIKKDYEFETKRLKEYGGDKLVLTYESLDMILELLEAAKDNCIKNAQKADYDRVKTSYLEEAQAYQMILDEVHSFKTEQIHQDELKAIQKAQDDENLKQGCLYIIGFSIITIVICILIYGWIVN